MEILAYKQEIFTLTSYIFLTLNVLVCAMSAFNMKYNNEHLPLYMGKQVIRHFALSLFVIPACTLWIYNLSFMQISFAEAVFWCLWHSYNAWNGICLNFDVCKISKVSCADRKEKINEAYDRVINYLKGNDNEVLCLKSNNR